VAWYPNNPVLRALTPSNTCRNMDVYPVKLTQVCRPALRSVCVRVPQSCVWRCLQQRPWR
jgi:hypothetical protein